MRSKSMIEFSEQASIIEEPTEEEKGVDQSEMRTDTMQIQETKSKFSKGL